MELSKGIVLIAVIGFSSAFLLQDINTNKTTPVSSHSSSETYDQKIDNLMTFLAEEKRLRYQLEQRLDEAERKLQVTERFHEAVNAELLDERTTISHLEQMNKTLNDKLNNASNVIENMSHELQTMKITLNKELLQQNLTEMIALYGGRSNQTCACNDKMVAFSAYKPVSKSPVVFSNVTLNVGGAYNLETGKFVCNQPGLYFFPISLVRSGGNSYQYCCVYINTVTEHSCVVTGDGNDNEYPSGTQSEIVRLNMADEVSLNCTNQHHSTMLQE